MAKEVTEEKYRWVILALTYLCMLAFAFVFQSLPPILSLIITELQISHAQAGLLMSLFALPGIFLAIPGGMLSDYYGTKKVGIVSLVFVIVGILLVALGNSFLYLSLGRVLSGIGALTLAIIAPQLLSKWFLGRELGVAMGIFNTAMPVGTIICFNTLGIMGKNLGWQASILVSTLVGAIALVAFLLFYKSAPAGKDESTERMRSLFSSLPKAGICIWLVGFAWMWFNAAVISFMTFAPDFFITKGYTIGFAGFLTSLLMWGSLVMSPTIGYVIYKFGGKEIFIGVGGVSLALVIFSISGATTSFVFLMILMAIAVGFVPAPIFSLSSDILKPKSLGLGFGIISACSNVGVLLGPYLAGLARDTTGSYQMSFVLMSIFAILVTPTIAVLKVKRSRSKKG